jgi:ABC-type Fe3+/spermidine/putrescine transport system ATPase subunit
MSAIELRSVTKYYDGITALEDFSLSVDESERIVILGPSGCGKTTVLRLLAGLTIPDKGNIFIRGKLVATNGRSLIDPEQRNVGMVFQDLALWPHLTVKANLEFGLKVQRVPDRERRERLAEMLSLTRLTDYIDVKPGALSGGQQQRVALARALILRPAILLMDEALSNLDPELSEHLRREVVALQQRLGFTLLYVTHNRDEALEIGTRTVYMRHGRIDVIKPLGASLERL